MHSNLYSYREGKSTEDAIHKVVNKIQIILKAFIGRLFGFKKAPNQKITIHIMLVSINLVGISGPFSTIFGKIKKIGIKINAPTSGPIINGTGINASQRISSFKLETIYLIPPVKNKSFACFIRDKKAF